MHQELTGSPFTPTCALRRTPPRSLSKPASSFSAKLAQQHNDSPVQEQQINKSNNNETGQNRKDNIVQSVLQRSSYTDTDDDSALDSILDAYNDSPIQSTYRHSLSNGKLDGQELMPASYMTSPSNDEHMSDTAFARARLRTRTEPGPPPSRLRKPTMYPSASASKVTGPNSAGESNTIITAVAPKRTRESQPGKQILGKRRASKHTPVSSKSRTESLTHALQKTLYIPNHAHESASNDLVNRIQSTTTGEAQRVSFSSILSELQDLLSFHEMQAVVSDAKKTGTSTSSLTTTNAAQHAQQSSTNSIRQTLVQHEKQISQPSQIKRTARSRNTSVSINANNKMIDSSQSDAMNRINLLYAPTRFKTFRLFPSTARNTESNSVNRRVQNGDILQPGKSFRLWSDVNDRLRWIETLGDISHFTTLDGFKCRPMMSVEFRS